MNADEVKDTLQRAAGHVARNPGLLRELAWHALFQRIPIPIDVLRWALDQLPEGKGRPKRLTIESREPALLVSATVVLMKQELSITTAVHVLDVRIGPDELTLRIRLTELEAVATPDTPMAQLLSSGAVDLKRPAKLLSFLPKRPAVIADASGDIFELDLLAIPRLRDHAMLRKVLRTAAPIMGVSAVRTDGDLLLIELAPRPSGLPEALQAAMEP